MLLSLRKQLGSLGLGQHDKVACQLVKQRVVNAHSAGGGKVFWVVNLRFDVVLHPLINLQVDRLFGTFLFQSTQIRINLIGLPIKIHQIILLAEVFQLRLSLFQGLLNAKQFIVDKFNGVFADEVFLFQTAVNIFIHQQIGKIHDFPLIGAINYNRSHRRLPGKGTHAKTAHLLDKGRIAVEPKEHLYTFISFFISFQVKFFSHSDANTVVSVINPLALVEFTSEINFCIRVAFLL